VVFWSDSVIRMKIGSTETRQNQSSVVATVVRRRMMTLLSESTYGKDTTRKLEKAYRRVVWLVEISLAKSFQSSTGATEAGRTLDYCHRLVSNQFQSSVVDYTGTSCCSPVLMTTQSWSADEFARHFVFVLVYSRCTRLPASFMLSANPMQSRVLGSGPSNVTAGEVKTNMCKLSAKQLSRRQPG